MNHHTYLFNDWEWNVDGIVTDPSGKSMKQIGSISTKKIDDIIRLTAVVNFEGDNPMEMVEVYDVVPFAEGSDFTTWSTNHPHAGKMNGSFWIIGDTIHAHYINEKGEITGSDFYRRINGEEYHVTGAVYMKGAPIANWFLKLTRKK